MRRELGFDAPFHVQYGMFLGRALQGDLGRSLQTRRPVLVITIVGLQFGAPRRDGRHRDRVLNMVGDGLRDALDPRLKT
jgi:hypothetical protein